MRTWTNIGYKLEYEEAGGYGHRRLNYFQKRRDKT